MRSTFNQNAYSTRPVRCSTWGTTGCYESILWRQDLRHHRQMRLAVLMQNRIATGLFLSSVQHPIEAQTTISLAATHYNAFHLGPYWFFIAVFRSSDTDDCITVDTSSISGRQFGMSGPQWFEKSIVVRPHQQLDTIACTSTNLDAQSYHEKKKKKKKVGRGRRRGGRKTLVKSSSLQFEKKKILFFCGLLHVVSLHKDSWALSVCQCRCCRCLRHLI